MNLFLPCLFVEEGLDSQVAHVGKIVEAKVRNNTVQFEIVYDITVAPIINKTIVENKNRFDLSSEWELTRTHWAVKDIELFRVLIQIGNRKRAQPKVFRISDPELITESLVAVMMPFGGQFDAVYKAIDTSAKSVGMQCKRADGTWEDSTIIEDIVTLIDRARIVVCDCSTKNANVFYEAGIAHSLGRDVVMITQPEADVPSDLRHHRYLRYLPNTQGLKGLTAQLTERLKGLTGR